jgi:hypothetical protein
VWVGVFRMAPTGPTTEAHGPARPSPGAVANRVFPPLERPIRRAQGRGPKGRRGPPPSLQSRMDLPAVKHCAERGANEWRCWSGTCRRPQGGGIEPPVAQGRGRSPVRARREVSPRTENPRALDRVSAERGPRGGALDLQRPHRRTTTRTRSVHEQSEKVCRRESPFTGARRRITPQFLVELQGGDVDRWLSISKLHSP